MSSIRTRKDQKIEDTWNLERIYATVEDWNTDKVKAEAGMKAFAAYQGKLGESSKQMQEILDAYCDTSKLLGKLMVYASMRLHENTADSFYQQMDGDGQQLLSRWSSAAAWIEPELMQMDEEKLKLFLNENPKLQVYRVYLEECLRKKAHTLSEEREELLAKVWEVAQASDRIYSMFQNADLTFQPIMTAAGDTITLTQGNFVPLEESKDRAIRKAAFESYYASYKQYENTLAALMDANVRQAVFFAREHRYNSSLEAALDDAAIPTAVYHQLITVVNESLPLMHRYVALRKKLLGTETLHMYDVYAPMVESTKDQYSFEEAEQIVLDGLAPLGEEYSSILKEGFANRWIDRYENEGKRGGAYSWGSYGTDPYVLMNYQGSLDHVFTLAHEMGHSVHSYYTRKTQPYIYGSYKTFVAEVASTCNEVLLIRSLLKHAGSKGQKRYLINHLLEKFKGTLYRQTMFAEFELLIHQEVEQGRTLNSEKLCSIYYGLNQKYFGPEMVSDPEIAYEWARIPHFYRQFYVYQYATGFSAAIAIAEKIWKQEPNAVENYKKFLSGGCSMSPIELLKLCGVDMTKPEPVRAAVSMFEEYLGELES